MIKYLIILMIKYLIILLIIPMLAEADVDLYVQSHEDFRLSQITTDWTRDDFIELWQQTHKGEIIDILPAGKFPGKKVHPPNFVKITVTGVSVEQARNYLKPLYDNILDVDGDSVQVKQRKYYFRRAVVDSALVLYETDSSSITLTKAQAVNFLKIWDIATIKQKIVDRLKQ